MGKLVEDWFSIILSSFRSSRGSKNTVVFETNDDFRKGLSPLSSTDDLLGEKVNEDLRLLLLMGVETPDDPLKSTSFMLSGGEVTVPLDGDLDLSLNLEL